MPPEGDIMKCVDTMKMFLRHEHVVQLLFCFAGFRVD